MGVAAWLEEIRVVGLEHVGDGPSPQDFADCYDDECVAIEITLLFLATGWEVKKEMSLAARFRALIADVNPEFAEGPRWDVTCEYDSW